MQTLVVARHAELLLQTQWREAAEAELQDREASRVGGRYTARTAAPWQHPSKIKRPGRVTSGGAAALCGLLLCLPPPHVCGPPLMNRVGS